MNNESEHQVKCNNCGNEIELRRDGKAGIFLMWLAVAGVMVWIPILGWLCFPVCILCAIISLFTPRGWIGKCTKCGKIESYDKNMNHK